MAQRRGLIHQRAAGKRRLTQWGLGVGSTAQTTVSVASSVIIGSAVTFGASATIIRMRGRFDAFISTAAAVGDGFQGAVGIGLATSAAFAIGITAIPTPITEAAWDGWLWHSFFGAHRGFDGSGAGAASLEIDSKAMRKVSDEMSLFAAIEVVEVGASTLRVHLDTRLLVKLG